MKKRIPPRARCPRIPVRPELNPIAQLDDEVLRLHYDYINFNERKLFPFPKWKIVSYVGEPYPPCFYIYSKRTAIAVSMDDCKIVGIKRKGRNPKIVKYVFKNLHKWLYSISADEYEDETNLEVIRGSWWDTKYKFSKNGQLMKMKDWLKLPEAQ